MEDGGHQEKDGTEEGKLGMGKEGFGNGIKGQFLVQVSLQNGKKFRGEKIENNGAGTERNAEREDGPAQGVECCKQFFVRFHGKSGVSKSNEVASAVCGRVSKQGHSLTFFRQFFPRPARMVGPVKKGFRMRHQAEESAARITDAGNGLRRTVRIAGIIIITIA